MEQVLQNTKGESFRADINGLRAWAVMMVVFYHFGIYFFDGGFIGVDIFFVISGLLMTGIILNGLESHPEKENKFSVLQFYIARARRTLPALIFLCLVLIVAGWFFLTPSRYAILGKHISSALRFSSNLQFLSESGYFDTESSQKWLLHTWSLSVEWQFYIVLPLVMALVWKTRPSRSSLIFVILFAFLVSLISSVITTKIHPDAAFYKLSTRAWEMLAGGLVCLLSHRLNINVAARKALEVLGFLIIICSVLYFDSATSWPGYGSLAPVVGTVLVLISAQEKSIFTGPAIAQWLGSRSYSIYLWHWPIVVALVFVSIEHDKLAIIAGVLLSVLLGHLSYLVVENRSRISLIKVSAKANLCVLVTALFAVIAPAIMVKMNDGVPSRLPADIRSLATYKFDHAAYREGTCFLQIKQAADSFGQCTESTSAVTLNSVLLWGDSHAAHLYPGLIKSMPANTKFTQLTASGCAPIVNMEVQTRPNCKAINDAVKTWVVNNRPDSVILAANWPAYDWHRITETIIFLHGVGVHKIDIVGPVPTWNQPLPELLVNFSMGGSKSINGIPLRTSIGLSAGVKVIDQQLSDLIAASKDDYISAYDILCDNDGCLTATTDNKVIDPTAWDNAHLTVSGSEYLIRHSKIWK